MFLCVFVTVITELDGLAKGQDSREGISNGAHARQVQERAKAAVMFLEKAFESRDPCIRALTSRGNTLESIAFRSEDTSGQKVCVFLPLCERMVTLIYRGLCCFTLSVPLSSSLFILFYFHLNHCKFPIKLSTEGEVLSVVVHFCKFRPDRLQTIANRSGYLNYFSTIQKKHPF